MKKAVVYTRVSTDKDDQKQSLEIQRMQYEQYCNSNDYELIKIYADIGTGTHVRNRPDFLQMLHEAGLDYIRGKNNELDTFTKSTRTPKFNYIIVKDQSRLSRNMQQGLMIAEYLRDIGVYIIFENSGVTTKDEDWKMRTSLLFMIAEEESRAMGRRIANSKRYQLQRGVYKPAVVALGYRRRQDKTIEICPEESPIVKLIFDLYVNEGLGGKPIADILNEKGYKTKRGKEFTPAAIHRIVKNKVYCGSPIANRWQSKNVTDTTRVKRDKEEWIELTGAVEPIVSVEMWEQAQKIRENRIAENSKGERHGSKPAINDDYFRKVICGNCGSIYVRHMSRKPSGIKYSYMCQARRKKGTQHCDNRAISVKYLDDYTKQLNIGQPTKTMGYYRQLHDLLNGLKKQIKQLNSTKDKLKKEIEKLKLENEVITQNLVDFMMKEQKNVVDNLTKKIDDNTNKIKELNKKMQRINLDTIQDLKFRILNKNNLLENKTIVDTQDKLKFVKHFEVFDHQVIVHFNYANFSDEIKEYNELFSRDPISDEFHEDELTQTFRRNHKSAREYWQNYDEELLQWHKDKENLK